MKKLTLICLALIFTTILFAQDEATNDSRFVLGGYIGLSYQKNGLPANSLGLIPLGSVLLFSGSSAEVTSTGFNLNPYFGASLNERVILGVQVDVGQNKTLYPDYLLSSNPFPQRADLERKNDRLGIGLFARMDIFSSASVDIFMQPTVSYYYQRSQAWEDEELTSEEKSHLGQVAVSPGLSYQLSEHFTLLGRFGNLSFSTGYSKVMDDDTKNNYSALEFNLRPSSFSFGLEFRW